MPLGKGTVTGAEEIFSSTTTEKQVPFSVDGRKNL